MGRADNEVHNLHRANTSSKSLVVDRHRDQYGGRQADPSRQLPFGVAVTLDGSKVYVVNQGSNTVSVIDTGTSMTVGQPISVANRPGGLALSRDGRRLYVTTGGLWNFTDEGVAVIDTTTGRIVGKPFDVSIHAGSDTPYDTWSGVTVSPNDGHVYVTNGSSNAVLVIDMYVRVVPRAIKVGSYALDIAASPDGRYIYTATADGVSIIDAPSYNSELVTIFG
jgi:YVTN family beta-propeller protein